MSCDRVDEAGRALRLRLDADVEPDRRVERHLLVDDQVGQLRLEGLEVLVGREVVLGLRPGGDRVDDAVDQLADAGLALRRAEVAAEVLADDDVGGELAPEVGDLDVLLLEDALARLVGDAGGPVLPGDLVVGMDARAGPAALEGQAPGRRRAVQLRAVEGGAVGAGVAVGRRGGRRDLCGPCLRREAALPSVLRRRPCCQCLGPSRTSPSSRHCRCSRQLPRSLCRRARRVILGAAPGRRSGPAGSGGRLGVIWRPQERYACREASQAQKHKMLWLVACPERYMWWFPDSALVHGRPTLRG